MDFPLFADDRDDYYSKLVQDEDQIAGFGSLMTFDLVGKNSIQKGVHELLVGDQRDQREVSESEPSSRSDDLLAALGGDLVDKRFKRKRRARPRGGWIKGCRVYPLIGAGAFDRAHSNPLEVEGTLVHKRSVGKPRKHSIRTAKRPSWLPEGWTVICKTRGNGASAGLVDKYYVDPVTLTRFRSKIQVKRHLKVET